MKQVDGDLVKMALAGDFDLLVHGCNVFCTQGKGIALQVKDTWPEAYAADCATIKGDMSKLGHFTFAKVGQVTVINAYTQGNYWSHGQDKSCLADYRAIKSAFHRIVLQFGGQGLRFGIPRIGAGLAGGDWDIISKIIDEVMANEDLTLVNYKEAK